MALGDVLNSWSAPGADGLAWDATTSTLWLCDGETIYNLDPVDGSTIDSFSSPGTSATDLAHDGTNLWVADTAGNNITPLDPSDGSAGTDIPSPQGTPRGLTWDGTSLWCADSGTNEIFELDPSDGTNLGDFDAPAANSRGLAWDPDSSSLWHANATTDLVYQLDPAVGTVLDSFTAPDGGPRGLAYDPATGTIWVACADTNIVYQVEGLVAPSVDIATLVEEFDEGLPASMTSFGGVTFVSGGVEVTAFGGFSGLESVSNNYALESSSIVTQMTVVPDAGNGTVQALLNLRRDDANQVRIGFQADQLVGDRVTTGPTFTNVFSVTYSTTGLHDWLAIAESGGTVALRSSHDGSAWTDQGSFTASLLTSPMVYQVQLLAGHFGEEDPPLGVARFEHINVEPRVELSANVDMVASAGTAALSVTRELSAVADFVVGAAGSLAVDRNLSATVDMAADAVADLRVDQPVDLSATVDMAADASAELSLLVGYTATADMAADASAELTVILGPRDVTVEVGATRLGVLVGDNRIDRGP